MVAENRLVRVTETPPNNWLYKQRNEALHPDNTCSGRPRWTLRATRSDSVTGKHDTGNTELHRDCRYDDCSSGT